MKLPALFATLCAALSLPALSMAEPPADTIFFKGETYVMQQEQEQDYVRLAQFVRPQEDLSSWTRLVAIRHHPRLMNPRAAAEKTGRQMQEQNRDLTYKVIPCNNGTEAVLEFIVRSVDGSFTEFNAWRFMKRDGYAGLVSYQFSHRAAGVTVEKASLSGQDWIDELISTNFDYRFGKMGREAVFRGP